MKDKIDAVILFVDMNDKEWRSGYNDFIKTHEIPNKHINNETRFRDYGSLRGVLRSIDKYAPWINNVFLVVQSESQVPKWVDRETVKVVLHEEFIPREFLPTFNCNTIETHLHFIPGLSEKFIYFNDDMLLNSINIPEDYFIGDKCVHHMIHQTSNRVTNTFSKFYTGLRYSNVNAIYKVLKNKNILDDVFYNSHGPTPMLKSICEEIYNKIDISKHISTFREKINLTQELFTVYALCKRKLILLKNDINRNYTLHKNIHGVTQENVDEFKLYFLKNVTFKTICVNDVFENNKVNDINIIINEIQRTLNIKLKEVSKYEKKY